MNKDKASDLSSQEEKEKRIRREVTKFRRLYRDFERDEKTLIEKLALEASFMSVTLEDLKTVVNTDGVVTKMPQGSYEIDRENPALRSYNAVIQRYNTTIKQIFDMLSKSSSETSAPGNIEEFIKKK